METITDQFKDGLKPPWKVLDSLRAIYKPLNKTFNYKHDRANHILKIGDISELEDRVYNMVKKVDILEINMDENIKDAETLTKNASNFLEELRDVKNGLTELVKHLTEFGMKHVDVHAAAEQADRALSDIKNNIKQRMEDIESGNNHVYDYCKRVTENADDFQQEPPQLPYNDLGNITEKLDEIDFIAKEVEERTALAEIKNDENNAAIDRLKNNLKTIESMHENTEGNIKEITSKIKAINQKLDELKKIVDDMDNFDFSDFDELEMKLSQFEEESPDLEDLVRRASEHVVRLKKVVQDRIG